MEHFRSVGRAKRFFGLAFLIMSTASSMPCLAQEQAPRASIVANITKLALKITGTPPNEKRYAATPGSCVKGGVPSESPLWDGVLVAYKGLPVQDCSPTIAQPLVEGKTLTGRALLLLPTAAQAAEWIVSSCEALKLTGVSLERCAEHLLTYVKLQNGLQFVIAGVIREPNNYGYSDLESADLACKKIAETEALYAFRDGITVRQQGQLRTSFRAGIEGGCRPYQPKDLSKLLVAEPSKFADYGRVAGLKRQLYSACTHKAEPSDNAWRALVRESMIAAWSSNRYTLLDIVAHAGVAPDGKCKIKGF
jgi:hypothetical protein